MGFPIATTVSAASAFLSAVAASASWLAARRANTASDKANATAETLAAIERERRHSELRPHLDIVPPDSSRPDVVRFRFTGPDELEPLGPLTVVVTVRDDRDRSDDNLTAGGPTREQIAAHLWGPWRLRPGVSDADQSGRFTKPRTVEIGDELWSAIDKSPAPSWYGGGQVAWERAYETAAIRLRVEVTIPGFQPWVFLREIEPWLGRGVSFAVECERESIYLLRNVGTNTAKCVTVAEHSAIVDRPQGLILEAGQAVRMVIAGAVGGPDAATPTALAVTWEGQSQPTYVAVPQT